MDLTPDPKLYMIIARQQAELDFDGQKVSSSLVASYACNPGFRLAVEAAYRAGQEDAAREVANPIEKHDLLMADRVADVLASAAKGIWYVPPPWTGGFHEHVAKWLAQVAEQIVAGLAATPEQQGALSLAQAYLEWRQVDQPRTPSGCDGEDSPEERTDG